MPAAKKPAAHGTQSSAVLEFEVRVLEPPGHGVHACTGALAFTGPLK